MSNLDRDFVWECDYGDRRMVEPVLKTILEAQSARQLQMVQLFVNNNPYNLEFFVVFSYTKPENGQINEMNEAMMEIGAHYRPDITHKELMSERGRFNSTTLIDSRTVDLLFPNLFHFAEKKIIAKRVSMRPLGRIPVFLGHASRNKPEIEELIPYLNGAGLSVWFDKFNIEYGQSIVDEIQKGVASSGAVIFWVTETFLKSSWCKTEMRSFVNRYSSGDNIRIICVLSPEVYRENLPIFLQDLRYIKQEGHMTIKDVAKEIIPALKKHFTSMYNEYSFFPV